MGKILPFAPKGSKEVVEGNIDKAMRQSPEFKRWAEAFVRSNVDMPFDYLACNLLLPPPPHDRGN